VRERTYQAVYNLMSAVENRQCNLGRKFTHYWPKT